MRIKTLKLKNFKGIKNLEVDMQCENVNIYGDNATGKTTIFDAFTWLLFGKDSKYQSEFSIKPKGENGLNSEVEAVLEINDNEVILKKVYYEKWTKKRGSADKEFAGNTTDYFLDGVPVKKKEYEERINSIADEKLFKLLTNPLYFNTVYKWEDRRKMLIEVCGDITNGDVIKKCPELIELPKILNGKSIDDYKKILQSRRKELNKNIDEIPTRIDEAKNSVVDIDSKSEDDIRQDIAKLEELKNEQLQMYNRIKNGGEIARKEKELAEIDTYLINLKNEYNNTINKEIQKTTEELLEVKLQKSNAKNSIESIEKFIQITKRDVESLENRCAELRTQFAEKNKEEFASNKTCPTCKQSLPKDIIEESKNKFNLDKSKELEEIRTLGKSKKDEVEKKKEDIKIQELNVVELRNKCKTLDALIDGYSKTLEQLKRFNDFGAYKDYEEKIQLKQKLEEQINNLSKGTGEQLKEISESITNTSLQLSNLCDVLSELKQNKMLDKRIEELKKEHKRLSKEYEKCEYELDMIEKFIRTKVSMLDEKINSKFEIVRFKLFKEQLNGGLQECCEAMENNVTFSNLNNAMRINVGLDIINTLSEHYNFKAPIFIDNAESVTQLLECDTQLVRLVVSEQDKDLRVTK